MKKYPFFLVDRKNTYYRMLAESLKDELEERCPEVKCGYISSVKDVLRAGVIIICGWGNFPKKILLSIGILRKRVVLYHVPPESFFSKFLKIADWVVSSSPKEGYDYFPSPVLLSDLATTRHIERIWSKEKLVSKRGCIGVAGLDIAEDLRQKIVDALNLLIEDLDLNVIFVPILREDSHKDISIKYSANARHINADKYSSKEILGILSKIDLLITSDEKGIVCAMAVDRPVVGLATDNKLTQFFSGMIEEEILFDVNKLSGEEIYSKIKIAWVHRDGIAKQLQKAAIDIKKKADDGIKKLCKEFI